MAATLTPEGETDIGTVQTRGILRVKAGTRAANLPGMIVLETYDGADVLEFYLWFDSTGDLRTANAAPSDQDNDGTVVGGQS